MTMKQRAREGGRKDIIAKVIRSSRVVLFGADIPTVWFNDFFPTLFPPEYTRNRDGSEEFRSIEISSRKSSLKFQATSSRGERREGGTDAISWLTRVLHGAQGERP